MFRGLFSAGLTEWGDLTFHYDIQTLRSYYDSTWNPYTSNDNSFFLLFSPLTVWSLLSPTTEIWQRALFLGIFAVMALSSFLSFFALANRPDSSPRSVLVGSALGSLFFLVNPWVANRVGHYPFLLGYGLFPTLIFLAVRISGAKTTSQRIRLSGVAGIVLFVMTASFTMVVLGLILFLYVLICGLAWVYRRPLFAALSHFGLCTIVFLSVVVASSLYFILPVASVFSSQYASGPYWGRFGPAELKWISSAASPFNAWRLSGYWWTSGLFGGPTSAYLLWIDASTVVPILAFSTWFVRRKNPLIKILLPITVLSIMLSTGPNNPIGGFYVWLAATGPAKGIVFLIGLHDPDRWGAIVATNYSLLLAIFCVSLLGRIRLPTPALHGFVATDSADSKSDNNRTHDCWSRHVRWTARSAARLSPIFLLAIILIGGYPLLTGDLEGNVKPVQVPAYYQEINSFLKSDSSDFRVLWLPQGVQFQWLNSGIDPQASLWLSPRPVLYYGSPYMSSFLALVLGTIRSNDTSHLGKLLSLAKVKYVVFHNDTVENASDVLAALRHQSDLQVAQQSSNYVIFKNQDFSSYASVTTQLLWSVGNVAALIPLFNVDSFQPSDWAIAVPSKGSPLDPARLPISEEVPNDTNIPIVVGSSYLSDPTVDLEEFGQLYPVLDSRARIFYVISEDYFDTNLTAIGSPYATYRIATLASTINGRSNLTIALSTKQAQISTQLSFNTSYPTWTYSAPIRLPDSLSSLRVSHSFDAGSHITLAGWQFLAGDPPISLQSSDESLQIQIPGSTPEHTTTSIVSKNLSPQSTNSVRFVYVRLDGTDNAQWMMSFHSASADSSRYYYFYPNDGSSPSGPDGHGVFASLSHATRIVRVDLWSVLGRNQTFDKVNFYFRSVDDKPASAMIDEISLSESAPLIDTFLIYQTPSESPENGNLTLQEILASHPIVSSLAYQRVGPAELSVTYCTSHPAILNFGEAYHRSWAGFDGQSLLYHLSLSDLSNGFVLNAGCPKTVHMVFQEEPLFQLGIRLSVATLAVTSVIVILPISAFKKHQRGKR